MRRREFIGLIGGAAAAWPLAARAQPSAIPRVGYVGISERSTDVSGAGLRQGLVDKGYEIGRNLVFEGRSERSRRSLTSFSRSRSMFL
jgi:putative tryptophan/tyrosine transport system substrate-binding protein